MINLKTNKKGMTLIEVIVYLALFAIFFTTILRFVRVISEYNKIAEDRIIINQTSIFVAEHIKDIVENSLAIDTVNSDLSQPLSTVRLNKGTSYVEYSIENSKLVFTEASTNQTILTPSQVGISLFELNPILNSDETQLLGIKAKITIYNFKTPKVNTTIETSYIL